LEENYILEKSKNSFPSLLTVGPGMVGEATRSSFWPLMLRIRGQKDDLVASPPIPGHTWKQWRKVVPTFFQGNSYSSRDQLSIIQNC